MVNVENVRPLSNRAPFNSMSKSQESVEQCVCEVTGQSGGPHLRLRTIALFCTVLRLRLFFYSSVTFSLCGLTTLTINFSLM